MGSYDNWASLFLIHPCRILESQCGKRDSHLSLAYFTNLKNSKRYPPRRYAVAEMGVTKEQVESTLNSKLSPSHLDVIDTSGGCGASFTVEIVSEKFEGKRLLERHRMVNAALAEEMNQIHALSITKAVTPEQWKQQLESQKSEAAA